MTASEEVRLIAFDVADAHEYAIKLYAHAKAMIANGEHVLLTAGPALEPISIKQRKFLHGPVLGQISDQARVAGERYTTETWKAFFKKQFLPVRYAMRKEPIWNSTLGRLVQPKRATPHRLPQSTEELGVRAYSEFTNQVIDFAVLELGVEFVFTNEEHQLLRKKPTKETTE